MLIYSSTALAFLKKVKALSHQIIKEEFQIPIKGTKFLFNGYLYPLQFCVFEHPRNLGQFESHGYRVLINKKLIFLADDEVLKNILRHELCHFITYIKHPGALPHGQEFNQTCFQYGYDERVSNASMDISEEEIIYETSSPIARKIKKLLSLAESSNIHESSLATKRANELLAKHQLENLDEHDEELVLATAFEGKKVTGKARAIDEILREFFVNPVFSYSQKSVKLEISGARQNVEIAQYVSSFLNRHLEDLWSNHKKENPKLPKGISSKNSFMAGIARGYLSKIKTQQQEIFTSKELIISKNQLQEQLNIVYPRLRGRSFRDNSNNCLLSSKAGESAGKKLNVNKGLGSSKKPQFFLNWRNK